MRFKGLGGAALLLLASLTAPAFAADQIGSAVRIVNKVTGEIDQQQRQLKTNDAVNQNEAIDVAADSLGPAAVGSTAFELASSRGVDVPLISDEDIVAARRWLWQRCRILAEPGGSVALASLLTGAVAVHPGDTVVVVISGGNNPTIP